MVDLRYGVKGFPVIMPLAAKIIQLIYQKWQTILEDDEHKPVIFPAVIPEHNFEREAEHVEGFKPEVFWITEAGDEKLAERLALRPTSETAFYPMYSMWIQGRKDLPLKLYQSVQVWRYETKATRPFFRTREFWWIETHCAFANEEEARAQVQRDMENTRKILWDELSIPFMFFQRPQWDKFAGAVDTYAADTIMPDGRFLQLPSTHYLGTGFAKAFNIMFRDSDGNMKPVHQTCHGPPITRTLGALVAIHGDDKGLILPFHYAPVQVVVIPIPGKDMEKLKKYIDEINLPYRVVKDFRPQTPGWKFYDWEMKGVPFRIEVGDREMANHSYTVVRRDGKKWDVHDLNAFFERAVAEYDRWLKERAMEYWNSKIEEAHTLEEIKEIVSKGKVAKVPFCSVDSDGEACALRLKEWGITVRGKVMDGTPVEGECPICGREAKVWTYVGRQY